MIRNLVAIFKRAMGFMDEEDGKSPLVEEMDRQGITISEVNSELWRRSLERDKDIDAKLEAIERRMDRLDGIHEH